MAIVNSLPYSETLYRTLARNLPNGAVLLFDRDLRYLLIEGNILASLDLSPELLEGKTIWQVFPPETCAEIEPIYQATLAGEAVVTEFLYKSRLHCVRTFPVSHDSGEIFAGMAICQDITEQRQAEDAIERERRLFVRGPVTVFRWLAQAPWSVDYVSPNVTQWGYLPEDFTSGKITYQDLIHPDDVARIVAEVEAFDRAGVRAYQQDYRIVRADGEVRWVYDFSIVRLDRDVIKHYEGYVLDITERKLAEAALQESEEKFAKAFRCCPDGIVISTLKEGRLIEVNDSFINQIGYSRAEIIGKTTVELNLWVNPGDRQLVLEKLQEFGAVKNLETYFRSKSGEILVGLFSAEVIELQGVKCLLSVTNNITARKRAEEKLVEQARLEALRSSSRLVLAEKGTLQQTLQGYAEALVRHLDAAFARIWTFNAEQNVLELQASAGLYTNTEGRHARIPLGSFKIGRIAQEKQPFLTNGVADDPRIQDREWAKREGLVAFAGYPLLVEGRLVGVMGLFSRKPLSEATLMALESVAEGIGLNIERKQTEAQLFATRERDRLLAEMVLRIRRSLNLDQIISTTVEEVRQFLQSDRAFIYRLDDLKQSCQGQVFAESVANDYPPILGFLVQDRSYLETIVTRLEQGQAYVCDDVHSCNLPPHCLQDLAQYQIKASLAVPIVVCDRLFGVLVVHQCSQTRHWQSFEIECLEKLASQVAIAIYQAELYHEVQSLNAGLEQLVKERTNELEQKYIELQQLNQVKDEFLHAFSHDLRTPILGNVLVLKNLLNAELNPDCDRPVAVAQTILSRMLESSDRQLKLIHSLLEAHSSDIKGIVLHYEPVHLSALVQSILEEMSALLAKHQVVAKNLISADFPQIKADSMHLRRVFENLLANALNHNPPGLNITIDATVRAAEIHCTVADNGVGMTQEMCETLFERYVRGSRTRSTGIGLGLYLCRQIINAHGGQIWVTSQPYSGATFEFTLPTQLI